MFRSPLFPLFLTVFVDVLGLTLVYPLLPFYAEHFGASPLLVGVLSASYAACQFVSGPILGSLSDTYGRKRILLISQLGTLLGFTVLGAAQALWMLFLGRIIDGLTAGNLTIAQAYIGDVTKPENRTRAYGIIGVSFGLGFMIGPVLSGTLAHRFGYSAPAWGAAFLSLLSVLFTFFLLPDIKRPAGTAPRRSFEIGRYFGRAAPRRRLLQFFFYILSFSGLIGGLALFLERRYQYNVEQTGLLFAYSGFLGALVQGGLIGRLVKKLGEERLALAGLFLMVIGQGLLGFTHSFALLLLMTALGSLGNAVVRPSLTTLITRSVDPDEQGSALGLSQSLASLAQVTGPVLSGFLIGSGQLELFGIVIGASALVAILLQAAGPRDEAAPAAPPPAA
jgi:MFS family permease